LFCDDDDVVATDWVTAMVTALATFDFVGGTVELELLNRSRGIEPEVSSILEVYTDYGSPPYAIGANVGVKRHVFEAIGGYDEEFAGGGDDADICWRAQLAGYLVGFADDAVIHRRLRASLGGVARQFYAYGRMTALLRRKHAQHWPPRPIRHAVKDWGITAAKIVTLARSSRDRRWWVGHSAMLLGRLHGCVRYRILAP
jgi:GT2 family glycosyltransferase